MRTVTIAYLPSATDPRFDTIGFVKNLHENPPAGDLLLFSDHDQPEATRLGFNVIKLKKSPDSKEIKNAMIQPPWGGIPIQHPSAVNNAIFMTAWGFSEMLGYSHFLYLEEDCRVKNHANRLPWDAEVLKEFFDYPRHLFIGGSVMAFDVANFNRPTLERWERFLVETKANGRRLPIPPYGQKGAQIGDGCNIFVNGAGGVYSCAGLNILFPERKAGVMDADLAIKIWAWDYIIGIRLFSNFKGDCWELVGYLNSVCSQYGNILSTPEERLQWLEEGRFCISHQHKRTK